MSMSKYESEVKHLARDVRHVYSRFADLSYLSTLRERIKDPAVQQQLATQVPADKLAKAEEELQKLEFDTDSVKIDSPMGKIVLRIIERDEPKLIKFEGEGTPIPLNLWIQLLPEGECATKMRVTVGADLNVFMKPMFGKQIQKAADGLANMLAMMV